MTDKQIIIDSVPVQDCVFFYTDIQEEIICDLYPTCGGCKGTDCYYKQHKRDEQRIVELNKTIQAKEQECEKAKQNAQDTYDLWQALIESFNILQGEKIKLEQENEELKETNDGLLKVQYKLADSNKKLRQALTEIKEIIHFNKTNRLSGGACISIEQILQICDEVNNVY
jgi:hypothetical protein